MLTRIRTSWVEVLRAEAVGFEVGAEAEEEDRRYGVLTLLHGRAQASNYHL